MKRRMARSNKQERDIVSLSGRVALGLNRPSMILLRLSRRTTCEFDLPELQNAETRARIFTDDWTLAQRLANSETINHEKPDLADPSL